MRRPMTRVCRRATSHVPQNLLLVIPVPIVLLFSEYRVLSKTCNYYVKTCARFCNMGALQQLSFTIATVQLQLWIVRGRLVVL